MISLVGRLAEHRGRPPGEAALGATGVIASKCLLRVKSRSRRGDDQTAKHSRGGVVSVGSLRVGHENVVVISEAVEGWVTVQESKPTLTWETRRSTVGMATSIGLGERGQRLRGVVLVKSL